MSTPTPTTEGGTPVTLIISHTAAEGTILDGLTKPETRKGTDVRAVLNEHKWTYRPEPGWFQRQSRDQPPRMWRINATANRLRELGYTVEVTVDDTRRDMATREAERAERMDNRADRLASRADRLNRDGSARVEAAESFFQRIPMGQPILLDHYSGKADRNRREREHTRLMSGFRLQQHSRRVAARADSAAHHMDRRYSPRAVRNRIARLQTEAGKIRLYLERGFLDPVLVRDKDGRPRTKNHRTPITDQAHRARLETELADLDGQLDYWATVLDEHITAGRARPEYGPDDVSKGQYVQYLGSWHRVHRVNAKSVSIVDAFITAQRDKPFTRPVPYRDITDVRWATGEQESA